MGSPDPRGRSPTAARSSTTTSTPGHARDAVDRRDLDDAPTHTELRHDPLLDEWVVVAGHRQDRTFLPPSSECPLCPTHGDQLTEVPEADYDVVVFENRFPSLHPSTDVRTRSTATSLDQRRGPGSAAARSSASRPTTAPSLASVDADRVATRPRGLDRPHRELSAIARRRAGVRASRTAATRSASRCRTRTGRSTPTRSSRRATRRCCAQPRGRTGERTGATCSPTCIAAELADGARVVSRASTGSRSCRAPPAGRSRCSCTRTAASPDLPHLDRRASAPSSPTMYLRSCCAARRASSACPMPYIAAWHQAPVHARRPRTAASSSSCSRCAARAEKLKYLAGSESAPGVWINDISPGGRGAGTA